MRTALAVLTCLPLLAGCAQPASPDLEAFEATYAIADGLQVTTTFGEVVPYLAADGAVRAGYLLHVQSSAPGERLGYDQAILGPGLEVVRTLRCDNWVGGDCTRRTYSWARPGESLPIPGGFAIRGHAHQGAPSDDAHGGQTAALTFDAALAPKTFPWSEHEVATRVHYRSLGPLPPLDPPAPARFAFHLPGALLPGSDLPLPGIPHSLDAVVAFLRSQQAEAEAMLSAGGCLSRLTLQPDDDPEAAALTVDSEDGRIVVSLVEGASARTFSIVYGRRAPFGEPALLRTTPGLGAPSALACDQRGPVMSVADLAALADGLVGAHTLLDLRWDADEGAHLQWRFQPAVPAGAQTGSVHLDAGSGLSWWLSPPAAIDP